MIRQACAIAGCNQRAYDLATAPSEVLCQIHRSMFFGSTEGHSYTQIGLEHATRVDAMDLAERFRQRFEIAKWQEHASNLQRVEVMAWCRRIEMQDLSTS